MKLTISIAKQLFTIACCAIIMFMANIVVGGLITDIIRDVRPFLPSTLRPYAVMVCLFYLAPAVSISIVAVAGGFVFHIKSRIIRLAAITYIVGEWLATIYSHLSQSLQGLRHFSFSAMAHSFIFCVILLVTVPVFSKRLCFCGTKLRENIMKSKHGINKPPEKID